MSKNNSPVSVVISTRDHNEEYHNHVKKMFSHPKTEIIFYINNNEFSLSEIYNKGLIETSNDIVVFMHDDLIIETPNLTPKIIKLFEKNPEYGIIGVAGTDNLTSGRWWENGNDTYGIVAHITNGKRHVNRYSIEPYVDKLKDAIVVDGLFMIIHKKRIKHTFNEEFKGFHFYDLPICVENYVEGIKVGITTAIRLTHKSVGVTNKQWEKYKYLFEALYEKHFPLKVNV